jgi:trehalose-phosphatase
LIEMTLSALPMTPALRTRLSGSPLVLFLDIDGTLAPIAPRPEYALIPIETRDALRAIVQLPGVHVAIVSGRSAADAARLVSMDAVWIIGNHGFEVAPPGGTPAARSDVAAYADRVALAASRCDAIAHDIEGVIVENKRWTLSVHYRLAHPRFVAEIHERMEAIARETDLRLTGGKEVLELRPPIAVDKGTAAVDLASSLGALSPGASILFAGDDRTDEDAFRELRDAWPSAVTIRVAAEQVETAAEFCVSDTDAVRELLHAVLALRQESRAA